MDQTIIFDKNYSDRLQSYSDILSEIISPKQVMSEWSSYLETTVDQFGWQAIWKIPHQICEKYKITFPTSALIFVDSICFEDLIANVKILMIQKDIKLPESLSACLFHLWPTEKQDETVFLNLNETSEALDNLRFFHKYLWRPWDEEDVESDWFNKNLIPRLKLYYDLKQGIVSTNLRDFYRLQLIESKEKYQKFRILQEELQDNNQDDLDLEPFDNDIPDKLRDLYNMIVEERRILELFENPVLREKVFNKNNESNAPNFWLVIYSDREFDEYFEFIQNCKRFSKPDCEFKTAKSLQEALNLASSKDTIFIDSGTHVVQSSRNFMEGGKIINVNYPKEAIITTTNEHLLFNFKYGEVFFQNLTFHLNTTRYGIRVRNGVTLKMENCTIQGYKTTDLDDVSDLNSLISTQQGIVSDKGATIHLENCQMSHLGTALRHDCGNVTLQNCEIGDVRCVVRGQVQKGASEVASMEGCKFGRYVECLLHIEEPEEDEESLETAVGTDGIKLFGSNTGLDVNEISNEDEKVPPVIIVTKKLQFRPVKNIFSNPAFNTTLNKI